LLKSLKNGNWTSLTELADFFSGQNSLMDLCRQAAEKDLIIIDQYPTEESAQQICLSEKGEQILALISQQDQGGLARLEKELSSLPM
jgi:hypothetical protein